MVDDKLKEEIKTLKGIGPKKAARLHKLGLHTFYDMLTYYPREYTLIGPAKAIEESKPGDEAVLKVRFSDRIKVRHIRKGLSITKALASDATGVIECLWYNQPFRANIATTAGLYTIRGKVLVGKKGLLMENPVTEPYHPELHDAFRVLPVYSLTEGLTQREFHRLTLEALSRMTDASFDLAWDAIADQEHLPGKKKAYEGIHQPKTLNEADSAKKRLIFDEFFEMTLAIRCIRAKLSQPGRSILVRVDPQVVASYVDRLPFPLTEAQKKVLREIFGDMTEGKVMNRLVQGDVGSGKTVVAFLALLAVVKGGFQGALMAPTEVLAQQHYLTLAELFGVEEIRVGLLTGSTKAAEKKCMKSALASGDLDIIIGTHALITGDVVFKALGLVITDEQHRFGVRQRALLEKKGQTPHALVMSATPIPRTIAHIFYGDLDVSTIDALPPGRIPVKTYHIKPELRARAYGFVRREAEAGRQAYVICPLVEESLKLDVSSATEIYTELKDGLLSGISIGLLHGRMDSTQKEKVLSAFKEGHIAVLVSTTVIEVGIHVQNATVMLIENAERFGLAQLHQLRGRVGRGTALSYCILVSEATDKTAEAKMTVLSRTTNGFEIAEKDLALRGPGDLMGIRQHGLPGFHLANPLSHHDLLEKAQRAAESLFSAYGMEHPIIRVALEKYLMQRGDIAMN